MSLIFYILTYIYSDSKIKYLHVIIHLFAFFDAYYVSYVSLGALNLQLWEMVIEMPKALKWPALGRSCPPPKDPEKTFPRATDRIPRNQSDHDGK